MSTLTNLRVVPDTNIILASQNSNPTSPNAELIARWQRSEFTLLFSDDTLREYIEKLLSWNVSEALIEQLIVSLLALGDQIAIDYFHLRHYPNDADDIAFILCAVNGDATHLISYDDHLLTLAPYYPFAICKPVPFLHELRGMLQ